jgi:hypothetical protein
MTREEIELRAERLRAVVEGAHGRVVSRKRATVTFELPADVSGGTLGMLTMSGLRPVHIGQTTRFAPRRIISPSGDPMIVCHGDDVTTAFYCYSVNLRGAVQAPKPALTPAEITRQPQMA